MRKLIIARARKNKRTARMLAKTIRYPLDLLTCSLTYWPAPFRDKIVLPKGKSVRTMPKSILPSGTVKPAYNGPAYSGHPVYNCH